MRSSYVVVYIVVYAGVVVYVVVFGREVVTRSIMWL
jgi:hypothetical protein